MLLAFFGHGHPIECTRQAQLTTSSQYQSRILYGISLVQEFIEIQSTEFTEYISPLYTCCIFNMPCNELLLRNNSLWLFQLSVMVSFVNLLGTSDQFLLLYVSYSAWSNFYLCPCPCQHSTADGQPSRLTALLPSLQVFPISLQNRVWWLVKHGGLLWIDSFH